MFIILVCDKSVLFSGAPDVWSSVVAGRRPSIGDPFKPKHVPGTTITLHAPPHSQGLAATSVYPQTASPKLPASPASSGLGSYQSPGQVSPGQFYPWHHGGQGQPTLAHAHTSPGQIQPWQKSPWPNVQTDRVKGKTDSHKSQILGQDKSGKVETKVTFTLTDSESSKSSESGFSEHVGKPVESYASVCSHCKAVIKEEQGHASADKCQRSGPQNLPDKHESGTERERSISERPYMDSGKHNKDQTHSRKDHNYYEDSHSKRDFRGRGGGQGYNRGQGFREQRYRDHYDDTGSQYDQGRGRGYRDQRYDRGRGQSYYRDRGRADYRGRNPRYSHRGRGRGYYDFHESHSEPQAYRTNSYNRNANIRRAVSAQERTSSENLRESDNQWEKSKDKHDRAETGSNYDQSDNMHSMSDLTLQDKNKTKERTSSDLVDKAPDTLVHSASNESNQTSSSNSDEWCSVTKKSAKKKEWADSPDNYRQYNQYTGDRSRDRAYSHPSRFHDKRGRGRGNRFYETGERDRQRYGRGFERNERLS